MRFSAPLFRAAGIGLLLVGTPAITLADDAGVKAEKEGWNLHGQTTVVEQWHGSITSPYSGTNSLSPDREDKHTATLTLFLGVHLWKGASIYYNPEITQGNGLSGSLGAAGFPNGEATRAGSNTPEYNTARLFIRQVIGLGGEDEAVEDDKNQLGETERVERVILTLGKFAGSDVFDANRYSHDPRAQFLNWSLMENGAWDYPADVKGYTGGFTAEWKRKADSFRAGVFLEPVEANGRSLDSHLTRAWGAVVEWELRYALGGLAGAFRPMVYWNHAHMGNYAVAVRSAVDGSPDIKLDRSYRSKAGLGLNGEQDLGNGLGVFVRAGVNDGHAESWAFTEIDRTVSVGLSQQGTRWGRAEDTVGLAGVVNGLSAEHRRYLAAGGYGFIVGDGKLAYEPEQIVECYYDWKVIKHLWLTGDFQYVANPGYNGDRGPAAIFAVRAHAEF